MEKPSLCVTTQKLTQLIYFVLSKIEMQAWVHNYVPAS